MTPIDWLSFDFIDETCRMNCSHKETFLGDTLLSLREVDGIQFNLNLWSNSRGQNILLSHKWLLGILRNAGNGFCLSRARMAFTT